MWDSKNKGDPIPRTILAQRGFPGLHTSLCEIYLIVRPTISYNSKVQSLQLVLINNVPLPGFGQTVGSTSLTVFWLVGAKRAPTLKGGRCIYLLSR